MFNWPRSNWRLLALGALATAILIAEILTERRQHYCQQHAQCVHGEPRPSETITVTPVAKGGYKLKRYAQEGQSAVPAWLPVWPWTAEEWIALLTALLAGGTGALAIYTARLWGATKTAIEDSRTHAAQELRAYVHIRKVEQISRDMKTHDEVLFSIMPENAGKTPAKAAYAHINGGRFRDGTTPRNFQYLDVYAEPSVNYPMFDIGPGQFTTFRIPVRNDALEGIVRDNELILIWGWIEYSDVFSGSERHRTEFCYSVMIEPRTGSQADVGTIGWHQHNGSDEHCLKPAITRPGVSPLDLRAPDKNS